MENDIFVNFSQLVCLQVQNDKQYGFLFDIILNVQVSNNDNITTTFIYTQQRIAFSSFTLSAVPNSCSTEKLCTVYCTKLVYTKCD